MANTEDFNIAYEYYERIDLAGDKSAVVSLLKPT